MPTSEEERTRRAAAGSKVYRGASIAIVETPDPRPGRDEILLKIHYCGICGSDTHVFESDDEGYIIFSGPARLPSTLGHEYTGEVVEVGADVVGFERGDIVTGESVLWCGQCIPCRQGMLNQCRNVELMGLTVDGAFSDYMAVKAKYCWKIGALETRYGREDLLKVGALIEPLGCAYNGIFVSGGGVTPGAYAIVYGAGPIGLGAVSLLRAAGAARVIALDVVPERLELARAMGADATVNPRETDRLDEALRDLTDGWGADIQVEAAGAARLTMPLIDKLYAPRGRLIYLARAEATGTIDLNRIVSGAYSIIGSRGHCGYGIFPNIIKLLEGGRLPGVEKMVTSVIDFPRIHEAFSNSSLRTDGKILIAVADR
jgi:hypothetical protein